jgi:hypothetical protein
MTSMQPAADFPKPQIKYAALLVFVVALIARLVALRFWTLDSGDSVSRVFLGWLWQEHPFFINHGGWGPLHFYMIASVMNFWPDPVWAPAALHILCGALAAVFIYKLTAELFGAGRAALLGGLAFAVYPMAIMTSLEAHAELIFVMFLALALWFLVRAWRPNGRTSDAVLAGLSMTLACMLRYEGWLLLPFLTLPLIPRWKQIAAFLIPAMIHPLIWMTGNAVVNGNPFYSFAWSSNFEREVMGHRDVASLTLAAQKIWQLVMVTEKGLTFPLSLLAALGIAWCLWRRRLQALWLIPPLGLFLLLAVAGARGSLWFKPAYTITFGAMIIPFIAAFFQSLGIERWTGNRLACVAAAMLAAVGISTIEPLWAAVPHGGFFVSRAAGQFAEQREASDVLSLINGGRSVGNDALIADFFGWQPTAFVASRSKVRPENVCIPNGAPVPMDIPALQLFLLDHRQGFIVTRNGGKLTDLLKMDSGDTGSLADVSIRLAPLGTVKWPGTQDAPEVGPGTIGIARYTVLKGPDSPTKVVPSCTAACPVSFCSA